MSPGDVEGGNLPGSTSVLVETSDEALDNVTRLIDPLAQSHEILIGRRLLHPHRQVENASLL
jgi:hypothetical protein